MKEEEKITHCPCCSTGDYSELFSKEDTAKKRDLRFGFIYFATLILVAISVYFIIPILLFMAYSIVKAYKKCKKDKDSILRSLAIIIFVLLGICAKKFL